MPIRGNTDGIARMVFGGIEGLAQFFTNLAQGIVENKELNVNHKVKEVLHEIAVKHMPFTDKIDELAKAGSLITDDDERKRFMDTLLKVEQEGQKVKQGLDEIRRYIKKSGMSEHDKDHMMKELDRCEKTLNNLYVANVPAYTYKQTMKLINQNGFLNDVIAMSLSNGNYALFYPIEHVVEMDKILETAALMYEQHPSPRAVKTEALMTAAVKTDAAILRFENITPELAERAVLEGGKYGFISMAKEERMDGSGMYDLICKAGDSRAARNRNYREAIEIITKSALSLVGPAAAAEKAKMRHSAREFQALEEGLQGSGYIFSLHTKDTQIGNDRTQMIDVGNFIMFDQEKYRSYHNGVAEKMVVNRVESEMRYESILYAAAQAGTGQKIFISDQRMRELENEAADVYQSLMKLIDGRPINERLDLIVELQNKNLELLEERQTYKKEKNHTMQKAIAKEMQRITAQIETIALSGSAPITENMVLERVVARELESHQFKYYSMDKEMAKSHKVMQKAIDFGIRNTRKEAAEETENKLVSETIGSKVDLSIGWEQIEMELNRIDPDLFISHELDRAAADRSELDPTKLTVSDVKEEADILDREFEKARTQAEEMLKGIRIRMQEVEIGMDAQNIDTPAAAYNSRLLNKYIGQMDRKLTGVNDRDGVEFKTSLDEHMAFDHSEKVR